MGDLPKPDKLTPSQRKRKRRQQSAEVSRQEKIKVSQQSAEVSRQEKIKVPKHRVEVRHDQNEENVSQRSADHAKSEVASFLQGLISQGIITTAHAAYLLDIYPCEIPSDLSLITGIELSWEYPHGLWNSKEGLAPLNRTQTDLFLSSVLDYLQHGVEVRHDQKEENTVSQRSGEMHLEEKEVFTPGHEPKGIPDILGATVAQQSAVMDLEKGHFTPGHEPKVIPDSIIIATVAQQSAVLHLAEMADFTPGYAPKVTPDENINATVEQQSADMHLEEKDDFTPGHEPKVIPDDR